LIALAGTGREVTTNLRYLLSWQEAGGVIVPLWSRKTAGSEDNGEASHFGLNPRHGFKPKLLNDRDMLN